MSTYGAITVHVAISYEWNHTIDIISAQDGEMQEPQAQNSGKGNVQHEKGF
jgi:hypothetical protein